MPQEGSRSAAAAHKLNTAGVLIMLIKVTLQVQQARRLGFAATIVGSDSWGNLELITLCGKDCEGLFFTTHYATDIATPKAQPFIKAYEAKFGKTFDDVAALTYDSLGLAFQAIRAAGRLDREAARSAMAGIAEYDGVTGVMQFKGTGDPIKSAVIIQIKEGKFRYHSTAKP